MHGRAHDESLLTAQECAERIGLSVRTLRLYEQHGLISPRRTAKQWRLYGSGEIARLNEILALKTLGLSLSGREQERLHGPIQEWANNLLSLGTKVDFPVMAAIGVLVFLRHSAFTWTRPTEWSVPPYISLMTLMMVWKCLASLVVLPCPST